MQRCNPQFSGGAVESGKSAFVEKLEKQYMKKSKVKKILFIIITVFAVISFIVIAALTALHIRTNAMFDDYASVYGNEKYNSSVSVDNVNVIKQDVSCGYAVIEMFSVWNGQCITEESLYEEYGKVVTSTGQTFCDEMNKQFPAYHTTMYKYLSNTELIDKVYESLSKGIPVPFEWAAEYEDEWTLHYSLITGLDVVNDKIVVANPYGYIEELTLKDFLDRTSFETYSDMPLYFKLAFAFGIFEKNTIFIVE